MARCRLHRRLAHLASPLRWWFETEHQVEGAVWIVETNGREELDLPQKMARLKQWCVDATTASAAEGGPQFGLAYVDQKGFEQHRPQSFATLVTSFREHQ